MMALKVALGRMARAQAAAHLGQELEAVHVGHLQVGQNRIDVGVLEPLQRRDSMLRLDGLDVTLVTPAADISTWSHATLEHTWIENRLYDIGVEIVEKHELAAISATEVSIEHVASGRGRAIPCASVVLVTSRQSSDALYHELVADRAALEAAGIASVTRIGDCLAPSTIAAAVYAGHRLAREIDSPPPEGVPFLRELPELAPF